MLGEGSQKLKLLVHIEASLNRLASNHLRGLEEGKKPPKF